MKRKINSQRTENESESKAEYSALEQAENLRNQKSCDTIEKKSPVAKWGASEPGQEGESPEWTIPI